MRKDYLGGILTLLLVNPAYASFDCHQTPTCGELGYSQSTSDCAGLKYLICPFDTSKVFCGGSGCASGKVYADGACQTIYASCSAAYAVAKEDIDNWDDGCWHDDPYTHIYLSDGTKVDCWAQSCDKGCVDGYVYAKGACRKVATSCEKAGLTSKANVINDRCNLESPDEYVSPGIGAATVTQCWEASCAEEDESSSGTTTQPSGCYSNCYDENLMRNNPMFAENSKNLHLLSDDNNLKLLSLASINQEDCYNKYVKALNSAVDDDFEVYKV